MKLKDNLQNKYPILTLLLALNTYAFAAEPLHNTKQQEQSWQKYLPTKKQVFIGACAAVGIAAVWYMRKKSVAQTALQFRPESSTEIDLKPLVIGTVQRRLPLLRSFQDSGIDNILSEKGSCNLYCNAIDDELYRLDPFHFCILDKKIVSEDHRCNFFRISTLFIDSINRWKITIKE